MARKIRPPRYLMVKYRDALWRLDLMVCRRALVYKQVEGKFVDMGKFATEIGASRSTASRFFSGKAPSLSVTRRVLDALGLKWKDVTVPVENDADDQA